MQRCEFCWAQLPLHAHFCGACGRTLSSSKDWPTDPNNPSGTFLRSLTTPDQINGQSSFPAMNAEQAGSDVTVRNIGSENEPTKYSQRSEYRETDDRDAILPDLLLLSMADKQTPPINVPTVQGTPQAANVPTVQGSPATPTPPITSTPPAGQASLQSAAP